MTEQERREHFAFLNGVAANMKESRKEIIDLLEEIKAEIKTLSNANPSYWHSGDMVERQEVLEIINEHIKEYTE